MIMQEQVAEKDGSIPASEPDWQSLEDAALTVLNTKDAAKKAEFSRLAAGTWFDGELTAGFSRVPPRRPARPDRPQLRAPKDMPRRRKAGSLQSRVALLHAIAHIELNAIDLAWDMVVRFGRNMPGAFLDDWVEVGDDEARHFSMIAQRLEALGSHYGALPAHDGLWEAAQATAENFAARLAVVPMVLEARGLDVTPGMIARLEALGDSESAAILKVIYDDEVGHVAKGKRWFDWHCQRTDNDPQLFFQTLVTRYFRGTLKPPFNHKARKKADFPACFYEPLATSVD